MTNDQFMMHNNNLIRGYEIQVLQRRDRIGLTTEELTTDGLEIEDMRC
jgi:hypothetical protein